MTDRCIYCGEYIPEGRQICWMCEHSGKDKTPYVNRDQFNIQDFVKWVKDTYEIMKPKALCIGGLPYDDLHPDIKTALKECHVEYQQVHKSYGLENGNQFFLLQLEDKPIKIVYQ